jgi:hypothetical protein
MEQISPDIIEIIVVYLNEFVPKKAQFTHERIECNVFLFDEHLKGSNHLKYLKLA